MNELFFEGQCKREQSQARLSSAECSLSSIFYQLIQVAIGSRVCLSHTPRADEWKQLYEMARKQSLVGVCFAGVQRLVEQRQEPPEMLYLTWMGMAAKIQQRNEVVNRQCVDVQKMLAEKGFRSCIFKGQANASLYVVSDGFNRFQVSEGSMDSTGSPTVNHKPSTINLTALRQSGDIDIWIEGGKKRVIELVQEIAPTKEIRETHAHMDVFPDTEVEAHYRPGLIRNFVKNAMLQKFFQEEAEACFSNIIRLEVSGEGLEIVAPTTEFNLVHQMTHIFHHLFTEGVGLRQVMDYYMVLRTVQEVSEVSRVQKVVSELGLERFASALMWVIKTVFVGHENDDDNDNFFPWTPNEKDGRFLLGEIMQSGNFGKYDERHDFRNMNVVQSLFRITGKNLSYLRFAPFDWFWSPLWRGYHFCSRKLNGYQ